MSATLVVRGEAGIGKTSILEYAVSAADGFTILRADGVESERDISFATVHRLLVPLLPASDALPPPQRTALDATLGLVASEPPDRFLVGLAVLTLLSREAERRPLLCVIDDAQSIDAESAALLGFVARRLCAEQMVVLFAVRDPIDGPDPLMGLPEIRVAGLQPADARQLLNSVSLVRLDPAIVERVVAETEGNPLALVELGRETPLGESVTWLLPDEPVPLSGRIEAHFRRLIGALPKPAQQFLLIAAAEPNDRTLVWNAATRLGLPEDASEPAIAAELLDLRRTPAFRHPLVRSAVYAGAPMATRRLVHATLAELIDASMVDSRAWHLAAAADGPDEATAAELERGAAWAHARGGWAARAAFLARAAELTPEGPRRTDRLLAAAEAAVVAATPARAHALLGRAQATLADAQQAARARRVEAALQSFILPGRVPAILLEAATALQPIDPIQARDTFVEALQACLVSSQLTAGTTPREVGVAALAAHAPSRDPEIADLMLDAFATRFAVGYQQAVPVMRRAVGALASGTTAVTPPAGLTRWSFLSNAASDLWDADGYQQLLIRLETAERQRGALDSLRMTLGGIAYCRMWAGDFAGAEAAHAEAAEMGVAFGEDATMHVARKAELFAWQGRDDDVRSATGFFLSKRIEIAGGGVGVNVARSALVVLDLARGRYDDALATAVKVMADDPFPHGSQVLPNAVEAAMRSGDRATAHTALDRLRERTEASGTTWALGLLARSQALAAGGDAEEHYLGALDLLGQTYVKTDLARAHLLYGEWLRRERRRTEARTQLQAAFDLFDDMGAQAFAERARVELAATGARARRRNPSTLFDLTPQELQVAHLVSQGATNREVAAALFISATTVDYHLRKVFRKLGVTSRSQLAATVGDTVPEGTAFTATTT